MFKPIMAFIAFLFAVVLVAWALAANNLGMTAFFAPKYEQVRRDTFEQSKAYRDGMVQELSSLRLEYEKAEEPLKRVYASTIRHKAAGVPPDALPPDLYFFIKELP